MEEEEEEEHCSNPADDVIMVEPANVANQNAPPPSGQAEVVARQGEVAPRDEIPQEDIHPDIINIPRQPPKVSTVVGPSGLNANNDMHVDELLNSRHPRETLPL